jgi:hypothetical protein
VADVYLAHILALHAQHCKSKMIRLAFYCFKPLSVWYLLYELSYLSLILSVILPKSINKNWKVSILEIKAERSTRGPNFGMSLVLS